eukprot:6823-Heterococcus_DN1.PRE.2
MGISKRILRKLSVYANAESQFGDAVFSGTGRTGEPDQALPIRAIKFTNRLHYFARPLAETIYNRQVDILLSIALVTSVVKCKQGTDMCSPT